MQRTSCRDYSVVCCRSVVPLRPSCSERRAETIRLSAVVLSHRYGRRAANVAHRGELPGLGPLTINLNINAKTNGIDVNNILT